MNSYMHWGAIGWSVFSEFFPFWVRTPPPKLGVFSKFSKQSIFSCCITQLVKKLQQQSLYKVVVDVDILPFLSNTKRSLRDNCLLRYQKKSFGYFRKRTDLQFFQKWLKSYSILILVEFLIDRVLNKLYSAGVNVTWVNSS